MEHQQTNAAAFDPAAWLARFREVGGWWILGSDGKPFIGWRLDDAGDPLGDQPRAMWQAIERNPQRRASIRNHLLSNAEEVL